MKKQLSNHAHAAKLIRLDLKEAFPSITFKVKSSSFSGGSSVDIYWSDGPTTSQVDSIVNKYKYGSFDAMQDLYEITNIRKDIPQVKYVLAHRKLSKEIILEAFHAHQNAVSNWREIEDKDINTCSLEMMDATNFWSPGDYLHNRLYRVDLTLGFPGVNCLFDCNLL